MIQTSKIMQALVKKGRVKVEQTHPCRRLFSMHAQPSVDPTSRRSFSRRSFQQPRSRPLPTGYVSNPRRIQSWRAHIKPRSARASLVHPQLNLLAYPKSETIVAQAYSPLGPTNSALLTDDTATAIAKKYRLQTSDELLGYLLGDSRTNCIELHWYRGRREEAHGGGPADARLAVGGKQKRLIMADCGIGSGCEDWP
ncbi:hypothetical protein FIBSPDRAFT_464064 [Athelia psychrophila]|uniref:Uncharacterized protein n=1 Tax=Athelia psychrophila TaxID=1759441 RepID=A0A166LQA0_9AGAM|nr:hypothetical protein FIBSPDRAFT_464064 [Fibularhizoctonia sp. CBS 109695]